MRFAISNPAPLDNVENPAGTCTAATQKCLENKGKLVVQT